MRWHGGEREGRGERRVRGREKGEGERQEVRGTRGRERWENWREQGGKEKSGAV